MNSDVYCERCGEKLDPNRAVWLDLSNLTGLYRAEPWPESESQGGFSFGKGCAATVLANDGRCKKINRG